MKPLDIEEAGDEILSSTRPSIASGLGPFVAESSGDSVSGASAAPTVGSPGLFLIPTAINEDIRRAVEAHEYMHLSTERSFPETAVLAKLARNAGIDDMIVQSVMDGVVNTTGMALEDVRNALENLAFSTDDDKYLPLEAAKCTDAQKAALIIRPGSIIALSIKAKAACQKASYEALTEELNIVRHKVIASAPPSIKPMDLEKLVGKFQEEVSTAAHIKDTARRTLVDTVLKPLISSASDHLRAAVKESSSGPSVNVIAPSDVEKLADECGKFLPGPHLEMFRRLLKTRKKGDYYDRSYCQAMSMIMRAFGALHEFKKLEESFHADQEKSMKDKMAELSPESHDSSETDMHRIRKLLSSEDGKDPDTDAAEKRKRAMRAAMGERIDDGGYMSPGEGRWGNMTVREIPFVQNLTMAMAKRKVRFGFEGAFRYPHRIPPAGDGSCFGNRRKIRGGTLLIDASGSMGLSSEDLRKIVETLPACTIAMYGGRSSEGDVVIIARNGQLVDLKEARCIVGGGNIVDGPAIQWLVQQDKPHILVSDGGFTGIGDQQYANLVKEACTTIASHNVIWLSNLSAAEQYVKKHKNMFLK